MKKQFYTLFLVLTAIVTACNSYGTKLEYSSTEVYYTDLVKKEEAEKLGNFLISSEFADGKKKSLQQIAFLHRKGKKNYAYHRI